MQIIFHVGEISGLFRHKKIAIVCGEKKMWGIYF